MAAGNKQEMLMFDVEKRDGRWLIYWLPGSNTLGVTNFNKTAYEIRLDTCERKKLMGNIAESLLRNKWSNSFKSKALVIEKLDEESACLSYVTRPVELARVEEPDRVLEINRNLFFALYSSHLDCQKINEPTCVKGENVEGNSCSRPIQKANVSTGETCLARKRAGKNWDQPKLRDRRKPGEKLITETISFDESDESAANKSPVLSNVAEEEKKFKNHLMNFEEDEKKESSQTSDNRIEDGAPPNKQRKTSKQNTSVSESPKTEPIRSSRKSPRSATNRHYEQRKRRKPGELKCGPVSFDDSEANGN